MDLEQVSCFPASAFRNILRALSQPSISAVTVQNAGTPLTGAHVSVGMRVRQN